MRHLQGAAMKREAHEQNRKSWNAATPVHNAHKRDQAAFLRAGGSTLFPEELELLGELSGRTLLHVQCNAGQDTLSLARQRARVTGVDISDEAIAFARQLSKESGIAAHFERADIYDWLAKATREGHGYDRVFHSYGVLGWLSDLRLFYRGVAALLAPGGRYVVVDFHPVMLMLDEEWRLRHPYSSHGEPLAFPDGVLDYVAQAGAALAPSGFVETEKRFVNPHATQEFAWGVGDVAGAIVEAGLRVVGLREWSYSNAWAPIPGMRPLPGNRFTVADGMPELPLMLGIVAAK
jgi:2-polyprenyl-3-methyl-5-hydroxy-6-metoxy-1,4-benzoquinol methylase